MSGWIKLHRVMLDFEWYDDHDTTRLLVHLLLTVNHEPSRYKGHVIPAGSRVAGRIALAHETGLSERSIRTGLERLKASGEVTIKTTSKFSIISMTKWEKLQDKRPADCPADDQQVTSIRPHLKNVRIKEEKKKEYIGRPADVPEKLWNDHLAIRKAKRQPITQTALDGIRTQADKLGWTLERALTEACERGWASFKAEWILNERKETTHATRPTKAQRVDAALQVFLDEEREREERAACQPDQAEHRHLQHVREGAGERDEHGPRLLTDA
ncbi:hypothetical protein [Methylobacterium oryzae]|uniref:hypothetical protein n=1 Tax=Methylobacterium oryzae TaxID=334852 RepID=UPI002F350BB4